MIAMQYSFTLPADYPMAIIHRRIAERGHLTDHFPNLTLKAYLTAERADGAPENLYAPFYLWDNSTGLSDFLCGDGFAGLSQSFGRPAARTWAVWHAGLAPEVRQARFATREIRAIDAHAPLGELRRRETEASRADLATGGALAAAAGFEPTSWTGVRFQLWAERPPVVGPETQLYAVGHLSLPGGS